MADLSPNAALLNALANQTIPWWKALAELVDNAFDADARRVEIICKRRTLVVKDDGRGIKNILAIATLGHHDRQESTQLGMYGIGAKDAWLFCSNVLDVVTVHAGRRASLRVDIDQLIKKSWQCDDPTYESSSDPSGTVITLPLKAGRNLPGTDAFDELAFAFTPAISSGLQIIRDTTKPIALRPHEMPVLSDVVQAEFEVDGKHVLIDMGILPDGQQLRRGPFWLQYRHRILDKCSLGIGQYSQSRIAGRIVLGEGWKLSKNKDDLTLNKDRLADAIFERIEPMLKKAASLSESIESAAMRSEIEGQLNTAVSEVVRRKPGRNKGQTTGTVFPQGTKRTVTRASMTRGLPGNADCGETKSGRRRGFIFDWCQADPGVLGTFDRIGARVCLNENHPFVASARASQNRDALLACSASLIADDACRHDAEGNTLLAFRFGSFADAIGGILPASKEGDQ